MMTVFIFTIMMEAERVRETHYFCLYGLFDLSCDLGLVDIPEPEDIAEYFSNLPVDKDYFPYPNKLVSHNLNTSDIF